MFNVYDRPTVPMYHPDCRTACGKLQTTSCMLACRLGWAAVAMCRSIIALRFAIILQQLLVKLRLIGFSCVIICERRLAYFSPISRDGNFPDENLLIEILRESYDILIYERCLTFTERLYLYAIKILIKGTIAKKNCFLNKKMLLLQDICGLCKEYFRKSIIFIFLFQQLYRYWTRRSENT